MHGGRVACEGEQGGDDMHENVGANLDNVCLNWSTAGHWYQGGALEDGQDSSQKARLSVDN